MVVVFLIAAALTAFVTIFVAEFGDKTQLVSLTMACRYPPLQVLAGAMTALALVLGLAVGVGGLLAAAVPHSLIALISGLVFIVIGIFSFLRRKRPQQECSGRAGFLQTMIMVFIAEFGDKTQLAAMLLAAGFGYPLAVFGGAMAAMLLNHLLAIYLGSRFISRLDPVLLASAAAVLFVIIGLVMIVAEAGPLLVL